LPAVHTAPVADSQRPQGPLFKHAHARIAKGNGLRPFQIQIGQLGKATACGAANKLAANKKEPRSTA
jgi:hypothetical protein